jgi:hypothetical protein
VIDFQSGFGFVEVTGNFVVSTADTDIGLSGFLGHFEGHSVFAELVAVARHFAFAKSKDFLSLKVKIKIIQGCQIC